MVEGGMKCVKFLLFAFNLVFVLVAIGLIAAGAYVQIQLKDYFDLIEGSFSSAAALLIAVGVIIFFIAFFGCCGAYKENHTCVLIFAVLLIIIFILEISAGIAGFVLKNKVKGYVEEYMGKTMKDGNKVWDEVQTDFDCCGTHGPNDWLNLNKTIPKECCKSPTSGCTNVTAYQDGCLDKFTNWVENKIYIVGAIGIAFAFIQLVGIAFACCLARAIKKEYEVV
jgi:CD63 antigen